MQTPRARNSSVEGPHRMSPSSQTSQKSSPSTNRTSRQIKVARFGSDSADSPNSTNRTPKKRSPKVLERGSPQSFITEKRVSKLSDLESQLTQLEDELRKTKDQLNSSESLKRRALHETEEMKKQFAVMSARLEESQQQLHDVSTSEDARIQELRNLSQERDRVWQSEVEAIQKQHSMDSTALASALNEIQKLKRQLELASDAKATHSRHAETAHGEIECLRNELSETVSLVENMRKQFSDSKDSEVQALKAARETQMQLEEAMAIAESLQSEGIKSKEAYNDLSLELEKSKEKAGSLEILVKELEENLQNMSNNSSGEIMLEQGRGGKKEDGTGTTELKAEHDALKLEVDQLKSALAASELRYQEEYNQSTMQIRNAFDEVERTKSAIGARETELDAELEKARSTIDELESKLNKDQNFKLEENEISAETPELEVELKTLKGDMQDLKAVLLDKEIQIQKNTKENERLKAEIEKRENEQCVTSAETAKAAEKEIMIQLEKLTEEVEQSSRKAAQVAEQLDAAQKANAELETELRKLKVQSDQWRKAAEAAAAMLSNGSDAKFVDRSVSCNSIAVKMESPLSDDIDDGDSKKKNGNMLKKFGVLWKKGHK